MYALTRRAGAGCLKAGLGQPTPRLATISPRFRSCVRSTNGTQNGTKTTPTPSDADECDYNIGEYCSIDGQGQRVGKRTVGEMEQEFLAALSSFYFDGKPMMSDDEFEILKEELIWAGSTVAVLDVNEKLFLEASLAYAKGKPIMSDEEFDELKLKLRQGNSVVAAQGPRCSIRSKKMYSDCNPDYVRTTLLNLPGTLFVLGVIFAIDASTDFSVTNLVTLPAPYGIALLWGLLLPTCYVISTALTNIGFKDGVVLKGACPNCGAQTYTYFGDILTVPGNRGQNSVECGNCNASLTVDEYKRIIVVSETPEEKAKKAAATAAKKAASAAKKKVAA